MWSSADGICVGGEGQIARVDDHGRHGPGNPESWVVVADPPGRLRVVEVGDLVVDDRLVAQGDEPVRAPLRDVEQMAVVGGQRGGVPAPVARGGGAEVENDVVDLAAAARD